MGYRFGHIDPLRQVCAYDGIREILGMLPRWSRSLEELYECIETTAEHLARHSQERGFTEHCHFPHPAVVVETLCYLREIDAARNPALLPLSSGNSVDEMAIIAAVGLVQADGAAKAIANGDAESVATLMVDLSILLIEIAERRQQEEDRAEVSQRAAMAAHKKHWEHHALRATVYREYAKNHSLWRNKEEAAAALAREVPLSVRTIRDMLQGFSPEYWDSED